MITELTQEQIDKIPEFRDKWFKTIEKKIDKKEAERTIGIIYKELGFDMPKIIYARSPFEAKLKAAYYKQQEDKEPGSGYDVGDIDINAEHSEEIKQIASKMFQNQFWNYWGTCWSAYYDFAKYIGVKFDKEKFDLFTSFCKEIKYCIPFDIVCFISQNPIQLNVKGNELHGDGKPAIEYADGYKLYVLNGVKVPKWLAMTPADELKPEDYKLLKNADVKAEFIQKIDVVKMVGYGKLIDSYKNYDNDFYKQNEYELYDMSILYDNIPYAPHLKMKNQTRNVYHLEAVVSECKTIGQALAYREEASYEITGEDIIFVK